MNCGDEIGQLNGWDYKSDPALAEDSRNLHRSCFDWEKAAQRTVPGTVQNALWRGMEQLRTLRAEECFAPDAWVTTWDSHNPAVLTLVRRHGTKTLAGLFNFTEQKQCVRLDSAIGVHLPETVWLDAYEARIQ